MTYKRASTWLIERASLCKMTHQLPELALEKWTTRQYIGILPLLSSVKAVLPSANGHVSLLPKAL